MRAVFVRRRAESRATPAWMGGLNYEDHGPPKLPWHVDKRALSSDFASALQTRAHTGVSEHELEGGGHARRTVVRSRPPTSGRTRMHSARAPIATREPLSARDNRPQTAGGALGTREPAPSGRENLRPESARAAVGIASVVHRTGSAVASTTSSENSRRAQAHRFYTLRVNVLGVGGSAHQIGAGDEMDADSGFYNACVSLAVDGTSDGAGQTHVSKPFKFCEVAFIAVPENWVHFDLTGNVNRMLLCVKMLRKTADSHKAGEAGVARKWSLHRARASSRCGALVRRQHGPWVDRACSLMSCAVGSCLLDIGAVLKAGGSKMEVCKLTHDKMGKNSLDVHLQLQMQARTRDFEYEWDDVAPIFKKAGYVITATAGIQAPQSFVARKDHQRKATKRPNLTMQDLLVGAGHAEENTGSDGGSAAEKATLDVARGCRENARPGATEKTAEKFVFQRPSSGITTFVLLTRYDRTRLEKGQ